MKRYRLATGADIHKNWRAPTRAPATVAAVTGILQGWDNESSRIKKRGKREEFSRWRRTFQTGVALLRLLLASKIGDFFTIQNKSHREIAVRVVDTRPNIIQTEGTDAIDRIYTRIMADFRNVESWGICSCRDIGTTGTISQHAYCNAWDLHAAQDVMEAIFHFLIKHADELNVHTVIYNHRIWSRERPYIHEYIVPPGGDDHETHVHVDPDPQSPGRPCAA